MALAILPGVLFAVVGFTHQTWKKVPYPGMQAAADRLLGPGMYEYMFLRAGVALVLGSSATLSGLFGLARSLTLEATSGSVFTSLFFLSAGIGMLCMFVGQQRFSSTNKRDA